jgi:hypothetical protein
MAIFIFFYTSNSVELSNYVEKFIRVYERLTVSLDTATTAYFGSTHKMTEINMEKFA